MNFRPILLIAALVLTHGTASASTAEAEKRLHQAVDEVVSIADRATSVTGLAKSLRPILVNHICFDAMTRRAIGPGWRQFSGGQQKEAIDLFTTLIIRTYSSKFTPGEHPEVTFKTARTPAPGRVEIPTMLLYKGSRYEVVYRLEEAESWRITDVIAEGVSLVANYRTQFDSQFQKGGANAVINSLSETVTHPR